MSRNTWTVLRLVFALLIGFSSVATSRESVASDQPPDEAAARDESPDDESERDPEALAELKRATDFLTSLPRFHLNASAIYDVIQDDGRRLQFEKHGDIDLERPDKLYVDVRLDDGRHRQLWFDGRTLSLAERSLKLHSQIKAPPTIDQLLDMLETLFKDPMPLADLLYSNLEPLTDLAWVADVVGESEVGERPCLHLSFRGERVDWQIWVDQGPQPFIRKLVISHRELPGAPQFIALLNVWETPKRFDEDRFVFEPPRDSQWVNVLVPKPRQTAERAP